MLNIRLLGMYLSSLTKDESYVPKTDSRRGSAKHI